MLFGRRDFMRVGSMGALGVGLDGASRAKSGTDISCILLWQSGGCGHLDTFDMKPDAPSEYRGEFQPIPTNVPGIRICEHLPLLARHADKYTILRSMHSRENNHERARNRLMAALPQRIVVRAPLGEGCLRARRLVENGARFVTVTHSPPGYDTHRDNFKILKDVLLPEFDRALAALLQDLDERGMLDTTLVVAMGEFGRSPRINKHAGRDHHNKAWSIVLAGGGIPGGRVLGATDKTGTEVTDLPVQPEDLVCSIQKILGAGSTCGGRMIPGLLS